MTGAEVCSEKEDATVSNLTAWKVHGPVRSLRIERAKWDLSREEWRQPRNYGIFRFRPDGEMEESEQHNPDGSIYRSSYRYDESGRLLEIRSGADGTPVSRDVYEYDDAGRHSRTMHVAADGTARESEVISYQGDRRLTKVRFLPPAQASENIAYVMEGSETGFGAPGAVTMTVLYDEQDLPIEHLFHDANHGLVNRIVCTRDAAGRLLTESQLPGPRSMERFAELFKSAPAEERDRATAALEAMFGRDRPFSTVTYRYDNAGRLAERDMRTGDLGSHRTTYTYDDNGLEILNTREDEPGSQRHHARFEYVHDLQGNWTEHVVWTRPEPNPNFQRSNVERRQISYY
jgi:YD repeat-containing protein